MKSIAFLTILLLTIACNPLVEYEQENSSIITEIIDTLDTKEGSYFFDFDELVHYNIEINDDILFKKKEKMNPLLQLQYDLLIENTPNSINDTFFVSQLDKIGFHKNQVPGNKFSKIQEIFREKETNEGVSMACIAVYRDILLFKKNKKIIGIAKICFTCNQHRIHGTTANTINFGQEGDYYSLSQILH
jgi:hypothetical protein